MENSPYTDVTLQIFETLWGQGYRNIGVVAAVVPDAHARTTSSG